MIIRIVNNKQRQKKIQKIARKKVHECAHNIEGTRVVCSITDFREQGASLKMINANASAKDCSFPDSSAVVYFNSTCRVYSNLFPAFASSYIFLFGFLCAYICRAKFFQPREKPNTNKNRFPARTLFLHYIFYVDMYSYI